MTAIVGLRASRLVAVPGLVVLMVILASAAAQAQPTVIPTTKPLVSSPPRPKRVVIRYPPSPPPSPPPEPGAGDPFNKTSLNTTMPPASRDQNLYPADDENTLFDRHPNLRDGCFSLLQTLVFRTQFYPLSSPRVPEVEYANFTSAICALPYTSGEDESGIRIFKLSTDDFNTVKLANFASHLQSASKWLFPEKTPWDGRSTLSKSQQAILLNWRLAVCPGGDNAGLKSDRAELDTKPVTVSERIDAVMQKLVKLAGGGQMHSQMNDALSNTGFASFQRSFGRCVNLQSAGVTYT